MKKKMKKAFTLVELLVVIAILAILSTVAVVGYNSFTEKARKSADEQAVAQMNTALMAQDINDELNNIIDVQEFLMECDLDIKEYKPLSKDAFFFWDKSENTILYTDKDYKVTYPADQKDNVDTSDWYSLSGHINEADYTGTVENNGTVTVASAEQLYKLSNDYNGESLTINLNVASGKLNMMGASIVFNVKDGNNNFTMTSDSPVTISNIGQGKVSIAGKSSTDGLVKEFGGGIIANTNTTGTILFKNITIADSSFGSFEVCSVGAFVGRLQTNATIIFDNCHVVNCDINAWYRAAGFVGLTHSGASNGATVEFKNGCTLSDSTITTKNGLAAQLIGTAPVAAEFVVGLNNISVSGATLECLEGNRKEKYPAHNNNVLYHNCDNNEVYSTVTR